MVGTRKWTEVDFRESGTEPSGTKHSVFCEPPAGKLSNIALPVLGNSPTAHLDSKIVTHETISWDRLWQGNAHGTVGQSDRDRRFRVRRIYRTRYCGIEQPVRADGLSRRGPPSLQGRHALSPGSDQFHCQCRAG